MASNLGGSDQRTGRSQNSNISPVSEEEASTLERPAFMEGGQTLNSKKNQKKTIRRTNGPEACQIPSIQSFNLSDSQILRFSDSQKLRNSETQKLRNTETQKLRNSETQKL